MTAREVITRAFNILNIYDLGKAPTADHYNFASDMLNSLIKHWQAEGLRLWNRKEGYLFTAYQDKEYSLSTTGDHATNSYVATTLSAAEAAAQTTLSVTSSTGMTVSDNVGIKLSDGTRQWTTISSIPGSTSIVVADALTDDAESGATVVAYTSKVDRPLRVLSARWRDLTNNVDTPMEMIRFEEYMDLSTKNSDSTPSLFMYDKQLGAGIMRLWPRPDNVDYVISFTYYESLEDVDSLSDNIDLPQEWLLALQYNLAILLAVPFGQMTKLPAVTEIALTLKNSLEMFDSDDASIIISPNTYLSPRAGKY